MIIPFDLILVLFVFICAIAAITVKDLLSAVIILGAYSFLMCLLWTEMAAVDVAFTEASVSAGNNCRSGTHIWHPGYTQMGGSPFTSQLSCIPLLSP
jgi:energy-converting hydrogenase B subunit D